MFLFSFIDLHWIIKIIKQNIPSIWQYWDSHSSPFSFEIFISLVNHMRLFNLPTFGTNVTEMITSRLELWTLQLKNQRSTDCAKELTH